MSGPDWLAALFFVCHTDTTLFYAPALFAGLFAAWVIISTIPTILLAAPDEQSCLMIAPGQTLVRAGYGLEAIKLAGLGALMGMILLALFLSIAFPFLPLLHRTLTPHIGWMLWSAILFLAISERPRSAPTALSRWSHMTYTMAPILAGGATLVLSGLLGFVLYFRSPIPLTSSIMNFVPAVIGLFSVPGLLVFAFESRYPRGVLKLGRTVPGEPEFFNHSARDIHFFQAAICGAFAGIITALIPALTGTIGAFITQQLTGTRNARTQLVAQGITRMMYYGAGLFLIFLPGTPRIRSSSGAILRTFYDPAPAQLWIMGAIIGLSAITAWLSLPFLAKGLLEYIENHGKKIPAILALSGMLIFVAVTTRWQGLLILLTATGIGLLPVIFQARPIHGIGVILIPLAIALTQ